MSEQIRFTFALSGALQNEQISVLRFQGDEGISQLYEFNIELLSPNADLDIDAILQQPATLTLEQGTDKRVIQGIISRFDAVRQMNNQVLYKARLVPRLWELTFYHTNEVYLDMTVPEIIEQVLNEAGFTSVDYDLSSLQGDYRKWPYKCQYGETHLDFISRLMERDGIYYYFAEGDAGEKIIFCDDYNLQDDMPTATVQFSAADSLEINSRANLIYSFVTQQQRVPYKVLLKDYNDDSPSVDIKGEAVVDEDANKSSEIYVWGQNIETIEEGERLAEIRAEQIRAGKRQFHGESGVSRLMPGYFFKMEGHFRKVCNRDYCLLTLRHEAEDKRLLDGSRGDGAAYRNEFSAQPADIQFRPALKTHRPEIHGVLNAYVDSETDGHYADIDAEGRYRVLLPFDRVDRDGGKASHWVRMSQPFAGEQQGMHFPLRKGTEVLLTFVGGDPDRPVISGSLPNASAPSIVNSENHTNSMIKTRAGNKIEIEDKDGKNRIKLETPQMGTYMHLGAPNHPGDGWVLVTDGIERKAVSGGQQTTVVSDGIANFYTEISTSSQTATTGTSSVAISSTYSNLVGQPDSGTIGFKSSNGTTTTSTTNTNGVTTTTTVTINDDPTGLFKFVKRHASGSNIGSSIDTGVSASSYTNEASLPTNWCLTFNEEIGGDYIVQRKSGVRYYWADGVEFHYGDGLFYSFGNSHEVTHWNRFDTNEAKTLVSDMVARNVTGVIPYTAAGNNPSGSWADIVAKGELEVKQTDTFTAQNGNIYDFGGYWNYNFGNSYVENHMSGYEINTRKTTTLFGIIEVPIGHDKAIPPGPAWNDIKGNLVTLQNGTTWVEKSWGNSYSYVDGNSIEITDGQYEAHYHGETYEKFVGDTEAHFHGAAADFFMGAASEMYLGIKSEMSFAGISSIHIGLANDIFIGFANETNIAGKLELFVGAKKDLGQAAIDSKTANVEAAKAKLEKAEAALASFNIDVKKVKMSAEKKELLVSQKKAAIEACKAKIDKAEAKLTTAKAWIVV